jgi:IclR family acetate operon transcriptional repressor
MDAERNEPVLAGTQTLDRALSVLFQVSASGSRGLSLAECTAILEYSKPTTFRILRNLQARGMLTHNGDRRIYTLGPTVLRLGMGYLESLDQRREALPTMRRLGAETGETIHLGILDGGGVVYIEKVDSPQSVRMFSRIGLTMPAHSTGIGKAILAYLPGDDLTARLPDRLEARTAATITCRSLLEEHLRGVRARGYSTDDMENEDGISCVGAPIFDHTGAVCAGLSIAGPATRVTPDRFADLGPLVRDAGAEISAKLGYHPAKLRSRPEYGTGAGPLVAAGVPVDE